MSATPFMLLSPSALTLVAGRRLPNLVPCRS